MKKILFIFTSFLSLALYALDYEVQIDNEYVCVAKAILQPQEEIGLHRDAYPQVVLALKGGTLTRFEADGTQTEVEFPTNVPVFRDIDPPHTYHTTKNLGPDPIELIIVQIKNMISILPIFPS